MGQSKDRFPWIAAAAYLPLAGAYLLYWRHVEFFIDDWFLLGYFRRATEGGAAGVMQLVASAAQNRIYGVFRTQWLSVLYGFVITALGHDSARFDFTALLLLHVSGAWLLSQALWRFGFERGLAFLAGAFYLLAPTVHFGLFTYFTNPFFVFSTFWVLLALWLAGRGGAPAVLAVVSVAAIFSGEQVFLLVWTMVPLALFLFRRELRPRSVAAVWGAAAVAVSVYLAAINRVAIRQAGFSRRYEGSWMQVKSNALALVGELRRLTALPAGAPFQLSASMSTLAVACVAAVLVAALVWRWRGEESNHPSLWRAWWFAVAGVVLAYAPVLPLAGGYSHLRYHYVPTPYLAVGAAVLCWAIARRGWPSLAAGLVAIVIAYFTVNAASDIRQCWIPQSGQHRALVDALRNLPDVAPGDILILSGTPYEIGTAQHFTMHSSVSARPFAERITGIAPLEVGLELENHHGGVVLFQRDYQRALSPAEVARTHVLVSSDHGFRACGWVAVEVHLGRFELIALKGAPALTVPASVTFTRGQLALFAGRIYFARAP